MPALDAMRAIALVRVMVWHTWGWWPLSWFAAMPAMFFVAGTLLRSSLERTGGGVIWSRLRRLLIPFWLYSAVAVTTMLAMGWRPGVREVLPWIVPLADPVGFDESPGLWIPLWYLRAYLWFVLVSPLLWRAVRRWRWAVPLGFAAAVPIQQAIAGDAPLAVSDFLAYGTFVTAGMVLSKRELASVAERRRGPLTVLIVASLVGAVVLATQVGRTVNGDYLLLTAAGIATVSLLLAASRVLGDFATGRGRRLVSWICSRALSLYLWQGFGLLAADRIVTQRDLPAAVWAVASAAIVVVVTFPLAAVATTVEDVAARRAVRLPSASALSGGLVALVVVSVALLAPVRGGVPALPPSGAAALAAADNVAGALESDDASDEARGPRPDPDELLPRLLDDVEAYAIEHGDALVARGVDRFSVIALRNDATTATVQWTANGGVVAGADDLRIKWYSNAKAATAVWFLDLVGQGVVAPGDPVSRFLPKIPRGDDITLEQLSRHQSGIPSSFDTDVSEDAYRSWSGLIDEVDVGADVRRWMDSGELVSARGTQWNYSRVGYAILAWALERASGVSWQDAMRDLGRRAGIELVIDEDLAPVGTSNRHPGEGSYRGSLYSGGGLESSADDMVSFFHWALSDHLGAAELELMNTASPDKVLAYAGVGVTLACPCDESEDVVRGRSVGNGGDNGGWRHDIVTGTTIGVFPNRVVDEKGLIPEAAMLGRQFFSAVDG